MSFNEPVSARVSLDLFQKRGTENPDGWGIAFYQDGHLQIIKEVAPADDSVLFDFMERYHRSDTIVTHVRRSTCGGRSYLNTHPFYRAVSGNTIHREYTFAHNGTLTNHHELDLSIYTPLGETDSERMFCNILDEVQRRGVSEWSEKDFRFIADLLRRLNEGENTLNCIFSDGVHLFCYSDKNDHNNGLRFVQQSSPWQPVELASPDERLGRIDIKSDSPEKHQRGYVISTRILSSKAWTEFGGGELIGFKRGEIVYPRERRTV